MVQKMRDCLNSGNPVLNVEESGLTTLPDRLPLHITTLIIPDNNLTSLPVLPPGLRELEIAGNRQLIRLPALPPGLRVLDASLNQLTACRKVSQVCPHRQPYIWNGIHCLNALCRFCGTSPARLAIQALRYTSIWRVLPSSGKPGHCTCRLLTG